MATITASTFLDNGTARTAGEAFAIGSGAVFTVRTDSRIHANSPASQQGSMGNPTFTDIGGEYLIDGRNVKWLAYTGGSGNAPAIGTAITQGAVSGYYLGVWADLGSAPTASGSAIPASGFIKLREVTGGSYSAGALTGITATASGAEKVGWIEVVYESGANFVVPRVGKFTVRGDWFELGTTNGSVGQQLQVPSTSSKRGYNYAPGAWVETGVGTDAYEFWPALNGPANGWAYRHIGYPVGATDKRGQYLRNLWGDGKLQFGQAFNLKGTYASVGAQASTYVGTTVTGTYTWASNILTFDGGGTNAHLLEVGMQCGFDFTSGSATDQILTVTKVIDAYKFECTLSGSGTSGNVTLRPGVTVTFTAHGLNIGEVVGCDFTSGTGVDGVYPIYSVDSANAYRVSYPHTTALTSGSVSAFHTLRFTVPTLSAGAIADLALAGTFTCASNIVTVSCTAHGLLAGMIVGLDFASGLTDANYQIMEVVDANTFTCYSATVSATGAGVTVRPGYAITLADHQKVVGETQYFNFSATITDGDYVVYQVVDANTFRIMSAHLTAVTTGTLTATLDHGLAVGSIVTMDFITGAGVDGNYTIRAVAATTFDINAGFLVAIGTSNAYTRLTEGHVPPSGCKVRIPNVLMSECAVMASARQINQPPNATIGSRPEFNTLAAGALDIEYLYGMSNYMGLIVQAYQCRIINCATHDIVNINEIATAIDLDNIGVGMYSNQSLIAFGLISCFAGGSVKNIVAMRGGLPGANGHAFQLAYCIGQVVDNVRFGIVQFARNTGVGNITTCKNLILKNFFSQNANLLVPASLNITIENLDHCDRIMGRTNNSTVLYSTVISGGSDGIKLDGLTVGLRGTIPDVHPLAGVASYTASSNLKFRNIGTFASPLNTGDWNVTTYAMSTPFVSGGNNLNVKIQRCYFQKLRVSLITTVNSDKNVVLEHLNCYPYFYGSGTGSPKTVISFTNTSLNGIVRGIKSASFTGTGQTSVYGTHFFDLFRGTDRGAVLLMMNEPTADTLSQVTVNSGVVLFNSSGGVEMRAIGAQATWEMPYFAQGHTGFRNQAGTMSGGSIGNYTLEYQIDTGSGFSAWKTLSGANLSAEVITPSVGFKLKIRITTAIVNSTAITALRLETTTTESAQSAISYPLDVLPIQVTGLATGSRVKFSRVDNDAVLTTIAEAGGQVIFSDNTYAGAVRVEARKASSAPFYQPWYTQTTPLEGATSQVVALQVLDE